MRGRPLGPPPERWGAMPRISLPLRRRGPPLLAVVAALLPAPLGFAADPQPYAPTLAPTGNAPLDAALRDSSNLIGLAEAPAGPFALVTRARDDVGRLEAALNSFGYYAGRVRIQVAGRAVDDPALPTLLEDAPEAPPVPVTLSVETGPQFKLRRVETTGAPPQGFRLDLQPGQPAQAAEVLAARDKLLGDLRNAGYALAKVDAPIATLEPAAEALDVAVRVEPGPRVDLGDISVEGLDRVRESYVRRRLLVHEGERFDPARIESARQDLASLGVFSTVRARAAERLDPEGRLPLAFEVTERPRRAVGFTAAYSTDLGASAGITFQHRNLFGAAEQLNLGAAITQLGGSASRGSGYNFTASLLKPDFLVRDQSITGSLQAVKESLEAYDRTAFIAGVTLSRRFSQVWTASAGVLGTQSRVSQEGVTRDYTLLGLPVGLRYDTTGVEGVLEPTGGIRAAAVATPTQTLSGAASTFAILQLSGSTYINLAAPGRTVLALRGLAGSVQGASTFQLPPDQRFYAGGGGTVRGYKYQSVGPSFPSGRPTGGTSILTGTVELRQRIGESFGAAVFVDAGTVGNSSAPGTGSLRVGAGVGARYYTAIGPIRLDVAVPFNKQRRDDILQVYIGIGQAF